MTLQLFFDRDGTLFWTSNRGASRAAGAGAAEGAEGRAQAAGVSAQPERLPRAVDAVRLLELAAELLDLTAGDTRLEAIFADGKLRYIYRHERLDREQVAERFTGAP